MIFIKTKHMFVNPLTLNDNVFLFLITHNSAAHLFDESDLLCASTSWTDLLHFQPLPVLKQYFSAFLSPYGNIVLRKVGRRVWNQGFEMPDHC